MAISTNETAATPLAERQQPAKPPAPFPPAVWAGEFLFVSGQASVDAYGNIVSDTFEGEMRRSFNNAVSILATAGMTLADVVQVRSYVGRQEDLVEYNRIYRELFQPPLPARTTLIGVLGNLLRFEVDLTARRGGPLPLRPTQDKNSGIA